MVGLWSVVGWCRRFLRSGEVSFFVSAFTTCLWFVTGVTEHSLLFTFADEEEGEESNAPESGETEGNGYGDDW